MSRSLGGHGGRLAAPDERLSALRADDRSRRLAFVAAVVCGFGLAWVHWLGLVLAGALVGLTRRSTARAVAAGLAFGVLAVVAGVLAVPTIGPAEFAGLRRVAGASVAVGLVLPAWGGLLRAAL